MEQLNKRGIILKKPVLVDHTGVYFDLYENFSGSMTKFIFQSIKLPGFFKLFDTGDRMGIHVVLVCKYSQSEHAILKETITGTFDKNS